MSDTTIIDMHLDLALNQVYLDRDIRLSIERQNALEAHMTDQPFRGGATVSLPELRRSRVAVCVATLLTRSGPQHQRPTVYKRSELDFGNPVGAQCSAFAQLAYYHYLERVGEIRLLTSREDLDSHWKAWHAGETQRLGVILSMEGADPILHPDELCMWYDAGLRAIGLTHYGYGRYGAGTHVEGPLTTLGREILPRMESCGIVLDVTHLSDDSMEEAFDIYEGPVWASHHNCRTLVPGDRQLTDAQIQRLVARDAVICVACDAIMLHPGWILNVTTPEESGVTIAAVADQVDHLCQLAGDTSHVGIGTDLDGAFGTEQTPIDLQRYSDLHRLEELLSDRGYSSDDIAAIFHGNCLRRLRSFLPASTRSVATEGQPDDSEMRRTTSTKSLTKKNGSAIPTLAGG